MRDSTPLGPGREFDVVRALVDRWGARSVGIGDDAAVLDPPPGQRLVISTDTSVEHVHFRRDWMSSREIGYRATAAALSDLAAMAATPTALVVAMTLPVSWRPEVPALADGIGDAAEQAGAPVIGGDLSSGRELSLTITVIGAAVTPLLRSGAQPGDLVWVTGTLGGPRDAIRALRAGRDPEPWSRSRLVRPLPRIREARWLADRGATAAIDISDGLVADARHLAAASGVRIDIDLERVRRADGIDPADAAASGEEYELLVTIPRSATIHDFEPVFGIPLTEIGRVADRGAPSVQTTIGGVSVAPPDGYDHFS